MLQITGITWRAAARAVLPPAYACLPLCSCASEPIMNIPVTAGAIGSMDIPSPAFFWRLKPWEPGTLATIDGYARFAKLSFKSGNRIRIEPLAGFPKMPLDNQFVVSSAAKLCLARSAKRHHIAGIALSKNKVLCAAFELEF